MKALPFTYIVQGKYWRFRHPQIGDRALPDPSDENFEAVYRQLIADSGAVVREADIARTMDINADERNFYRLYFVEVADDGPIKIGIAKDPVVRLRILQVGNHAELRLIGSAKGGRRDEERLHRRHRASRLRGEWFARTPELLTDIQEILSDQPLSAAFRDALRNKTAPAPTMLGGA